MQAWEVPRSARRLLPHSITAYHTPADFPFLLIRVPTFAHKAAQQPLSPQFSQISGVAASGVRPGGQTSAQQPLSSQVSHFLGMGASDTPPERDPDAQQQVSPWLSQTPSVDVSVAKAGIKSTAHQVSGPLFTQALSTAHELESSSQSRRTIDRSQEDDELPVEAPQSTGTIPSAEGTEGRQALDSTDTVPITEEARHWQAPAASAFAAVVGKEPDLHPEGFCAAIAKRLMDFGSALTGFPLLSSRAGAVSTPVLGHAPPAASLPVSGAPDERESPAEKATCRRADADSQPGPPNCSGEEDIRDETLADGRLVIEPQIAATADLTIPRWSISDGPAQMELDRPAEGQADRERSLNNPAAESSGPRSQGTLAESEAGGHAVGDLTTASGVPRPQEGVARAEEDSIPEGDLAATFGVPSPLASIGEDRSTEGDLPAASGVPRLQGEVACIEEDRPIDGDLEAALGGPTLQSGVARMEEDGLAEGQAGVERPAYALLVPCRVAMRGRFPLNGTYFQTNELFLDLESCQESKIKV